MKETERHKQQMRELYIKNRAHRLKVNKAYQKKTNYISEKTIRQRNIRNIKRKTRYCFPLLNKKCEFCNKPATERHHNTKPIKYDCFNFVCHKCHNKLDYILKSLTDNDKGGIK